MSTDRRAVGASLYLSDHGAASAEERARLNRNLAEKDLSVLMTEALGSPASGWVLDVGAGAGAHLPALRGWAGSASRVVALDFSLDAARRASRHAPAWVADGGHLPVRRGAAAALVCNFAAYYFGNADQVAQDWKQALRNGAPLVVSGPARGTNRELYDFHLRATGAGPSDADTMAWGFVGESLAPALSAQGFTGIGIEAFGNPVRFPDKAAFLDYWVSTSLFARTPGAGRAQGEALLVSHEGPVTVTKRVELLRASAPGPV